MTKDRHKRSKRSYQDHHLLPLLFSRVYLQEVYVFDRVSQKRVVYKGELYDFNFEVDQLNLQMGIEVQNQIKFGNLIC